MNKLEVTVDEKGKVRIMMDHYELKGVQAINFQWEVGEVTTNKKKFDKQVAKLD